MREPIKWTEKYQTWMIFSEHLKIIGALFIIYGLVAGTLSVKPIFKEIISVIFMLIYFIFLLIKAGFIAKTDIKDYTPTNKSYKKAIIFGGIISFSNLLLWAILKTVFTLINGEDGIFSFVLSAVFKLYTIPYNGIMGINGADIMWYSLVMMIVLPVISVLSGYCAGIKKFDFSKYISRFIYKKD